MVKTEECSPSAKACLTGEFLVTNGAETVSCFEGYCTNKVKRCDDYCNKMKSLIPQATGCKVSNHKSRTVFKLINFLPMMSFFKVTDIPWLSFTKYWIKEQE